MSNILGKVTGLYRYPVKSMGGEALDAIMFDKYGIMGDRTWTVRDAEKGVIAGGKKYPDLMKCDARFTEEPTPDTRSAAVEITCQTAKPFLALTLTSVPKSQRPLVMPSICRP